MKNKIFLAVTGAQYENNAIFGPDTNNANEPWRELKKHFASIGYDFVTADNHPINECAYIIFHDTMSVGGLDSLRTKTKKLVKKILGKQKPEDFWPARHLYSEAVKNGMADKMGILLWEGPVINPDGYKKTVYNKFNRLLTWRDDLVDNKKFFKYCLPVPTHPPLSKILPFEEKKLLVNVSANRNYPSRYELYSARAKTSAYFDENYPDDFDLFGAKWHRPVSRMQKYFHSLIQKFKCYRGVSPNKFETFSKYKFALAYENLKHLHGYITEKIFQIMSVGTVPIYWGAPNIENYVDPNAFIDRRKFKSDAELARYLKNIKREDYDKMVEVGKKYLASEQYKQFTSQNFCETIVRVFNINKLRQ